MRVLMVHDYYDSSSPSGEGRSFEEETELLRSFGHDVETYVVHNDEIGQYSPLQKVRLGFDTIWSTRSYTALQEIVRRTRREVVHFQNTLPLISPSSYWAVRAAGAAAVQTLRNFRLVCPSANLFYNGSQCERCVGRFPWPGLKRNCYRGSKIQTAAIVAMNSFHHCIGTWSNQVDRYIVAAEYTREKLRPSGIPQDRVRLKANYVPDPKIQASGQEYALFIGRLTEEKGVTTLMEAWRGLDIPLRVIGSGVLEAEVTSWAAAHPAVRYEGQRSPAEIQEALSRAAFVVMPSTWNETFGRVIVEANASGIPAITTRSGAQQELVIEGETGWLCNPGDAQDLRRILLLAWTNRESTALMGHQSRAHYLKYFGAKENCALLLRIYEEAIARHRAETLSETPDEAREFATSPHHPL